MPADRDRVRRGQEVARLRRGEIGERAIRGREGIERAGRRQRVVEAGIETVEGVVVAAGVAVVGVACARVRTAIELQFYTGDVVAARIGDAPTDGGRRIRIHGRREEQTVVVAEIINRPVRGAEGVAIFRRRDRVVLTAKQMVEREKAVLIRQHGSVACAAQCHGDTGNA